MGKSENKTPQTRIAGTGFNGSLDNEDSAWKVVFGYPLWDQYVAAEVSYIDLGKTELSAGTEHDARPPHRYPRSCQAN